MPSHRSRRALAITGTVLLLALVTAGCGRRGGQPDAAGEAVATSDAGGSAPAVTAPPPLASGSIAEPGPTAEPTPTQGAGSTPAPTAGPLATPDLTAIQQLLDDLDAALGADATADNDEGSAP